MSEPFVGEIRMFAGNFAPRGWAFCDGQLLAVSQNDALFSLLGTIYGGDGRTTFGLPDMRGRIPIHAGTGPGLSQRRLGAKSGSENVTVTANQLPSHTHPLNAHHDGGRVGTGRQRRPRRPRWSPTSRHPDGRLWPAPRSPRSVAASHTNLMPFLCVNFIIALFGIYPSRN